MEFPVYRKYAGIEVWFKITGNDTFIEIKKVGSKILISKIEATQFPEKLLIQDMLMKHENRWEDADSGLIEKILESQGIT